MNYGYGTQNSQSQTYTPQGSTYNQQVVPNQMSPTQNIQPLFPQPQGNVYNINSTLEVANVPVGAGVSVALCMPENVMFIKTMQNGNPLFYPYRILPFSNEVETNNNNNNNNSNNTNVATITPEVITELSNQIKSCMEKISALEEEIKSKKKGSEFAV